MKMTNKLKTLIKVETINLLYNTYFEGYELMYMETDNINEIASRVLSFYNYDCIEFLNIEKELVKVALDEYGMYDDVEDLALIEVVATSIEYAMWEMLQAVEPHRKRDCEFGEEYIEAIEIITNYKIN